MYEGEWEHGQKHGFGTLEFFPENANNGRGEKYEGQWKNDRFHGKGNESIR